MKSTLLISAFLVAIGLSVIGAGIYFTISSHKNCTVVETVSLGKIIDANVVPTSFNNAPKTCIKTEKAVVIIRSIVSVDLNVESYKIIWSDGHRSFGWEGSSYSYRY